MPADIDFAAEGLLDGMEGRAREERLELLERLTAEGYTLDDLRRVADVALLPAESAVGGPPLYTARDIAQDSGLDADFVLRVRRATGLPVADVDDRVFIEGDRENARRIAEFRRAGLSDENMLEVSRVLGRGLSQAAEAMRAVVLELAVEPGATEAELASSYAQMAQVLTPLTAPLVTHVLQLHLRHTVSTELVSAAEREEGRLPGAREVTIAFADLVGFTRLGESVPPDELGRVARRLETLTTDVIQPPVRLVKTIGDAAMLASPDADALLEATIDLVAAADAEGEDFPQLRAGVASGEAMSRAGDWYGRPVNLASRVTGIARPGSVLATKDVHDALEGDYLWSFAGARPIKGVGEVPVYRARHLPEEDPDAPASELPERPGRRARRRRR